MTSTDLPPPIEELEIRLLLEAVFQHSGYDFRQYALASLRRRIRAQMGSERVRTVSGLQEKVLHDGACLQRFLLGLTVTETAMFRDPEFFLAFRTKVVPQLRTYPFVRIWHAGCASGEEVYSMAILLAEEGLLDRCRIYATDVNPCALQQAREGIFPLAAMQDYTTNYIQAGGKVSFSEYYTARYEHAIFRPGLKESVVFAQHNLVTDSSFNEFHMIVCRNVMIYFDKPLQARVHRLFLDSLTRFGFLGLGSKESLTFSACEGCYEPVDRRAKLYRRVQ